MWIHTHTSSACPAYSPVDLVNLFTFITSIGSHVSRCRWYIAARKRYKIRDNRFQLRISCFKKSSLCFSFFPQQNYTTTGNRNHSEFYQMNMKENNWKQPIGQQWTSSLEKRKRPIFHRVESISESKTMILILHTDLVFMIYQFSISETRKNNKQTISYWWKKMKAFVSIESIFILNFYFNTSRRTD